MKLSIVSLLFAEAIITFQPLKAEKQNNILFIHSIAGKENPVWYSNLFQNFLLVNRADTSIVNPGYVGINTHSPVRPLHVVGSSLFENRDSNSTFANISLRKSYNGNFKIGAGKVVGAYRFQDGRAAISGITTNTELSDFTNVEITFNTTNKAGIFGERFRITEEGVLNYASDMSYLYTDRSLVDKAYVDSKTGSTLDGTLTLGNQTTKPIIFNHKVTDPLIRKLTPNNTDSVYQYNGQSYTAQAFTETIQRFDGVNSSGRPNYVWMFGYNQNGGGGRINNNDASMHLSMETHYESGGPLMELHIPQVQSTSGIIQRLLSFTVNKTTGEAFTYFTAGAMEFRSPATIAGGNTPHYASFSPAGIDLQNPDPAATTALRLYANNGSGSLTFQSGTGQSLINTNGSTVDLTIQTSRFLNLSNQIQFNNAAAVYNDGNVTFDLPTQDESKAFIFRDLGQHPLIEFRDSAPNGFPLTTVYGKLKMTGNAGTTDRLLIGAPDGIVNTITEGSEGNVLKIVSGKPTWTDAGTGWDMIREYTFTTTNTDPVELTTISVAEQEAISVVIDFVAIQSGGAAYTAKRSVLAVRNASIINIGTPQEIVSGNSISGSWMGLSYSLENAGGNNVAVRFRSANESETNYKAVIKYRKVQLF
jgi:hypothetical protein